MLNKREISKYKKAYQEKGYVLVKNFIDKKSCKTALNWLNKKNKKKLAKSWTEQEPGVDLAVFYNKKDLIEKIEYYLNNEDERAKIAKSGYNKFQEKYEYFVWSPDFVKEIETNQNKKNIVKSYIWPKKIKQFNSRFLNIKYLFSSGYINMILSYFDIYYIIKLIIKKYLLIFKL